MSSSRSDNADEFTRLLNSPREQLRRKMYALLDLFDASGFERGIAMDRFERGIREASDDKLERALEILRE